MTRLAGLARLVIVVTALSSGYLASASTPRPASTPGTLPVIPFSGASAIAARPHPVETDPAWTRTGAPTGLANDLQSPALHSLAEQAKHSLASALTETLTRPGASGRTEPSPVPSASPQALRKPAPARRVLPKPMARYGVPWLSRSGIASHMGYGFPASYLALPHGPGWHVRICGAGGCVTRWSNDAGPALYLQRQGRVADLSVTVFEEVCGVPSSRGLCPVSVTVLGHR